MTKPEFTENQINSLKACLHKAMKYWLEKNNIKESRVKFYNSISQTSLHTDIQCNFLIEPEKLDKDKK